MAIDVPPLRTALFVDFDNVYLGLRDEGPALAEAFGRHPERWLSWLIGEVDPVSPIARRRILMRRCYLNPVTFYTYRPNLVRAAFQVIDCPPLTGAGKNAADIQMVMDIMDTLSHPTGFDEFLILSGDSDFTPVLLRLRAHDRRTTILAMGVTSPAYRAAADLVLSEEEFRDVGLADRAQPAPDDRDRVFLAPTPPVGPPALIRPVVPAVAAALQQDWSAVREQARTAIDGWVTASDEPIVSATIAARLQSQLGVGPQNLYAGSMTFKGFITALGEEHAFAVDWAVPGLFWDPERHVLPEARRRDVSFDDPEVAAVARRVADVTDIPLLGVAQYAMVFHLLAEDVSGHGLKLAETTRRLRDAAQASGVPLSRGDANFIVKCIHHGDVQLPVEPPAEPINPDDIAIGFLRGAERNAERAQVILMPDERRALERWLAPEPPHQG